MAKETLGEQKKGPFRRGLEGLSKIHYGLGFIALGGALVFNSAAAGAFAAYEFVNGYLHKEGANWLGRRKAKSQAVGKMALRPKPA